MEQASLFQFLRSSKLNLASEFNSKNSVTYSFVRFVITTTIMLCGQKLIKQCCKDYIYIFEKGFLTDIPHNIILMH